MKAPPGRDRDAVVAAVASIRHDLNNLMMGLIGHVELLEESGDLPGQVRERLAVIRTQIDRIQDKLSQLAAVAPRQER